jgi:hypothetical protein
MLVVDRHDRLFPGEGCRALSAQVSLRLLALVRDPEVMNFFIISQSLSLCLVGYTWFRQAALGSFSKWYVVVVVVASQECSPLRAQLLPLLATLLGALDDEVGWRCSAATKDRFPAVWDMGSPDRLLVRGVLGGDVKQLHGGVPDDVIWCPEAWRLSCIAHATSGRLWPQSLRTKDASLLVTVSIPARFPHVALGLSTHVPLAGLTTCLGFYRLARLPSRALRQNTNW